MNADLLTYIRKGITYTTFFSYHDQNIQIRPITSLELNLAEDQADKIVTPQLARLLTMVRCGKLNIMQKIDEIVPPEMYHNIRKYYNELDFWITFFGMKDFLPDDFSIADVKKMQFIREISQKIIDISSATEESIDEIIKSNDGQQLAFIHYKLMVPLTDAAWKLTPLQTEFLSKSHPDIPKEVAKNWDDYLEKRKRGEAK